MNRPIIKGTTNHKASIAKAKAQSVVSQSRTKADAGLVAASRALGKSYKPSEIDFDIDKIDIDVPEKKERKEKQPRVKKQKNVLTEEEQAVIDAEKLERKAKRKARRTKIGGRIIDGVKTAIGGIIGTPIAIGKGLFQFGDSIVDELGNKVEGAIEDITKSAEESKKNREEANRIKKENEAAAKAEKEAAKLEADKLKKAELDKKEIEKALALERRNEEKLKKRLIREEAEWRRKNRNKKAKIKIGEVKTTGIGDQQINQQTRQYTKEQRERLNTGEEGGNIWSDDLERYVLPEEIVDGQFVSKAEGETIIVSPNIKGKTTKPVVEENKTLSKLEIRKKKAADRKYNDPNTSQYVKDQMIKEGYVPDEGKTAMNMRDNRIYRNAVKGGIVQQNMIKSGYKPE